MPSFSSTLDNGVEINVLSRSTHRSTERLFRTAGGPQTFLVILEYLVHLYRNTPISWIGSTFERRNLEILVWKSEEVAKAEVLYRLNAAVITPWTNIFVSGRSGDLLAHIPVIYQF